MGKTKQLRKRISAGDWRDEMVAAWREGWRKQVAKMLLEPTLKTTPALLVWFAGELAAEGGDLNELATALEEEEAEQKRDTSDGAIQLRHRLDTIAAIIKSVDNRAAAVDGPVTPTWFMMTDHEMREIYRLASGKR